MRVVVTVLGFLCFLGICLWAYSKRARKGFEEAAQLPFTEDERPAEQVRGQSTQGKDHG